MADKKAEGAKPEGEAAKTDEAAQGGSGGGIKAWLPLIVSLVAMPVIAVGTTKFLIIPKVVQAREAGGHGNADSHGAEADDSEHGGDSHGEAAGGHGGSGGSHGKKKYSAPIKKVIVNVAGSMGTRYLMTSFTLVGSKSNFETTVEENKDQLLDLTNTMMASKTIADLEKPGSRNQLRAELISIINNALGDGLVEEIYFTEFAIQ